MVDKEQEKQKEKPMRESVIERKEVSSVADFLDGLINQAAGMKASDIHIDPKNDRVDIRVRCLGSMELLCRLSKALHEELIGRIKILSRLRTDIHDRGQDGRLAFVLKRGNECMDIRVSILPTFFGENAVLRMLRPESQQKYDFASLGMFPSQANRVSRALESSQGMIIVAGPTGSGKTTTIYAMIEELASGSRNIITIEDPVEYVMQDVRQIQVSEQGGFGFAKALRSVVRQDPDVVVIGEMRDTETAGLAFQAAQTGHLVITSLHAEDSAGVHARLLDLGVSPRALHSLSLIISQRLMRQDDLPGRAGDSSGSFRSGIFEVIRVAGKAKVALFKDDFPERIRTDLRKLGECLLQDSYAKKMKGALAEDEDLNASSHE